ncbi:hypothetical protein AURDEDRAFT_177460 [Auricularia subglabra TFB-10046 SS5]|uniref:Uncharacterized protein n=1 Tax=Auricularia subglabra (strain TFB-10046 / SS5) TaxID=717982 RepID=J0CT53_AURST|nr:hypothetical protein AURDEDRAFT_177460 [Auricularia subglabra TFB-10046 SS5]
MVAGHGTARVNTTVMISQQFCGFQVAPVQLPVLAMPFLPFSPLVHDLGWGQFGPSVQAAPQSSCPAFKHPASQVNQTRDLVKEWADERMAADLKYWGDLLEKDEPKLSTEFMQLHGQWKSLAASERAVVQEKLEETKKRWLMMLKRA